MGGSMADKSKVDKPKVYETKPGRTIAEAVANAKTHVNSVHSDAKKK
jgi:hypothetical protein